MDVLFLAPSISGGGAEKQIAYIVDNIAELDYKILYFSEGNNKLFALIKCLLLTIYYCVRYRKFVVYSFLSKENLVNLYVCKLIFRKKIIVSLRNSPRLLLDFPSENKIKNFISRRLVLLEVKRMHKADIVISNSGKSIDEVMKLNPKCNNCKLINNGIEKKYVEDTNNKFKNIYFIARVDNQGVKNHLEVIEIAKRLPNYKFHLGGQGVIEKFENSDTPPNVTLYSRIENIDNFLNDKDILLNVSLSEGSPNLVIEAMQRNIYCISRDSGDVNILFEGTDNIIYHDIDEAVEHIKSYYNKSITVSTNKKINDLYDISNMINKNKDMILKLKKD